MGEVETLTAIKLRYTGKVIDLTKAFDNQNIMHTEPIEFTKQYMDTTVGRVILNDVLPKEMPFINGLLKKKGLAQLVQYCYLKFGLQITVQMLDEVKKLGFLYATRAGISIGIDDMVVPEEKAGLVRDAEKQVIEVQQQYQEGAITQSERYNKIIEIWSKVTEAVSDKMFKNMEEDDRTGRYPQPDLHHGRLRRPRFEAADSPALRYARFDGQALGRNHRTADYRELPRRLGRVAVLHLDARRA